MKNGLLHADSGSDTNSYRCVCTGVFQTLSSHPGTCMKGIRSGDITRPWGQARLVSVTGRDTKELADRHVLQGFSGFCELMPDCLSSVCGFLPGGSPGSSWAELPEVWGRPEQERGQLLPGLAQGECSLIFFPGSLIPLLLHVLLFVDTKTERTNLGEALAGSSFPLPPSSGHPSTQPSLQQECWSWLCAVDPGPRTGKVLSAQTLRIYASLQVRGSSLWGPGSLMLM